MKVRKSTVWCDEDGEQQGLDRRGAKSRVGGLGVGWMRLIGAVLSWMVRGGREVDGNEV